MYTIEQFRQINMPAHMLLTQHGRARLAERSIRIADIQEAISSGDIIEQYEDDKPFPSCLILGYSQDRPIHLVCSINDGILYVITAYVPSPAKWREDWKTRR